MDNEYQDEHAENYCSNYIMDEEIGGQCKEIDNFSR